MVTPTAAVKSAFRQYAVFNGRATRAEFWWWILFASIASFTLALIDAIIGLATGMDYEILAGLFAIATILPGLAVTCRRLHDIGKSGWWQLAWHVIPVLAWLAVAATLVFAAATAIFSTDWEATAKLPSLFPFFVALIAAAITSMAMLIWAIVWTVRPSQPGANRYGPAPHQPTPDISPMQSSQP